MAEVRIFPDEIELGAYAAEEILKWRALACTARGHMTLGCPSGRSARSTYAALARMAAEREINLSTLHLMMMDEFVVPSGDGWAHCPPDAHYSCARFGEFEIRRQVNSRLPPRHRIPRQNVHVPDPNTPLDYEKLIDAKSGIDLFILASGATDGHIAFNPQGTAFTERTRVVRLADETRRDNLDSFPAFEGVESVPNWGVTVGPATIARASRSVIMILIGPSKREAFRRIVRARDYQPEWPATLVQACADGLILADRAACSE
jgi:glucosamine-6-phosphate deaminase